MKGLTQKEFDKRCHEVFESFEGDEYFTMFFDSNDQPHIVMQEQFHDYSFDYEPNMTERPQALAYLMGERNDFND